MAFNGINNLRDSSESIKVERWQMIELKKCAQNPMYFIRNYVKINTKDKGMQKFDMYDFQEELIHKFDKYRFNIVKFPRQCGKCCKGSSTIEVMNSDGVVMEITYDEYYNLLNSTK